MKTFFIVSILILLCACQPALKQAERFIQKRDFEQAQQVLEQSIQTEGASGEKKILLAQVHFYTQNPQIGIQELHQLHAEYQDHPRYIKVKQALQTEFERLDTALLNKQALQQYIDSNPPAYFAERAHWVLSGQSKKTADPLLKELQDWKQAQQSQKKNAFEVLLKRYPHSRFRSAWYHHLLETIPKDKTAEREALLQQWLKEQPENAPRRARLLLKQAHNWQKSAPQKAWATYRTFLSEFPDHLSGRQAIYDVRNHLKHVLTRSDHRWLAEQAWKREMYQSAFAELNQGAGTTLTEQWKLAKYALEAKAYTQARPILEKLQKRAKGKPEGGLAGVGLATIQRGTRNYAGARQTLEQIQKAYQSQPKVLAAALWEEGILHDLANREDLRGNAYKTLVKIAPTDPQAIDALWYAIWEDYRGGRYQSVVNAIEQNRPRLTDHPQATRLLYWLARSHESLENKSEATAIYQQLSKGSLLDYYTHRAKERLRVLATGGEDAFATGHYQGVQQNVWKQPSYAQAFEQALLGDKEAFSPLMELVYLGQESFISSILDDESDPRYGVLHAFKLQKKGRYYEAVTQYRYRAEKEAIYLPAAFPLAWFETIETEAKANQLNPFLVAGLIWQESQYKPDIRSWVGATGLMQIMPATGQQIAKNLNLSDFDLRDPKTNIKMGSWYLRSRHDIFQGNAMLAVASYNAGAGPVQRWLRDYGHLPYDALAESITYPETRGYVRRVFTSFWIYEYLYGQSSR